jgi:hypothetical protein
VLVSKGAVSLNLLSGRILGLFTETQEGTGGVVGRRQPEVDGRGERSSAGSMEEKVVEYTCMPFAVAAW